jgi:hypothetical protein
MKQAAFKLVAFVVAAQLGIAILTIAACFITKSNKCTGDKVSELLTNISAQAFALYAAEK